MKKRIMSGVFLALMMFCANFVSAQNDVVVPAADPRACVLCSGSCTAGYEEITTHGSNPCVFQICLRSVCSAKSKKIWYVDPYNRLINLSGNIMKMNPAANAPIPRPTRRPVVVDNGGTAIPITAPMLISDTLSLTKDKTEGKLGVWEKWYGLVGGARVADVYMLTGKPRLVIYPNVKDYYNNYLLEYQKSLVVPVTFDNGEKKRRAIGVVYDGAGNYQAEVDKKYNSAINAWLYFNADGNLSVSDQTYRPTNSSVVGLVELTKNGKVDGDKLAEIGHDKIASQKHFRYIVKYKLHGVSSYRVVHFTVAYTAAEAVALCLSMGRRGMSEVLGVYAIQGGHKGICSDGVLLSGASTQIGTGVLVFD